MKYIVIVSETAKRQLASHISFLMNVSREAAVRTKEQLVSSIRSLSEMPNRFPFLDDELIPKNKYRKMLADRRYLVIYQVKDDTVYVEYVLDCRSDYQWLLENG